MSNLAVVATIYARSLERLEQAESWLRDHAKNNSVAVSPYSAGGIDGYHAVKDALSQRVNLMLPELFEQVLEDLREEVRKEALKLKAAQEEHEKRLD